MIKLNVDTFRGRFPSVGSGLDNDELSALIELLDIQVVEASEALIIEGTVTDSLYFIWEGQLDVVVADRQGEYKLASIETGDLLGEISLLNPGKTTATVRSDLGCIALAMTVTSLEKFWEQYPHAAGIFLQELNRIVTQRLRSADHIVSALKQEASARTNKLKTAQQKLVKG